MMFRVAILLSVLAASSAAAQSSEQPVTEYGATRARAIRDPAFRAQRIGALRLSIEAQTRQRDAIDIGRPITLTVVGGISTGLGFAVGILSPIVAIMADGLTPVWTWGLSSPDGLGSLEGVLIASGIGFAVGLAGLIVLVTAIADRDRARAARQPFVDRIEREQHELRLLESIDIAVGEGAAMLRMRAAW